MPEKIATPIDLPSAHFNSEPCRALLNRSTLTIESRISPRRLVLPLDELTLVSSQPLPGRGERVELSYRESKITLTVPFRYRWLFTTMNRAAAELLSL